MGYGGDRDIAKLYTRTGDDGKTFCAALASRVPKDHPLIEFMGALDEANTLLGYAATGCKKQISRLLKDFQKLLFRVGFSFSGYGKISDDDVVSLEKITDKYMEGLELKGFILPGGSECSSRIHMARTAVRRAERRLVTVVSKDIRVKAGDEVLKIALKILNRMSDALFALAVAVQAEEHGLEYV